MLKLEQEGEDDDVDVVKFLGLVKEYRGLSSHSSHPCTVAKEAHNITKNRFLNMLPYDHSRVVLKNRKHGDDGYINANYIDGYKKRDYYIATQGPLCHTIADFWEMVWQENSTIIVMLTNLTEQERPKCEQYWPNELQSQKYGDFTVTFTGQESQRSKAFIVRTLQLLKTGSQCVRKVRQFHYVHWPDHSVPRNQISIYRLLKSINQHLPHPGPMVIHCSAGVGRTGTFIAIDYLLKMAEDEGKVDVFQCVESMRNKRSNMVQTQDQYRFIYLVLLEALMFGDTSIPLKEIGQCVKVMAKEDPYTHSNGYNKEFEILQTFSHLFQFHHHREALKSSHQMKNRFSDILPAEHVRPSLLSVRNLDGSCGYINAVFTDSYLRKDGFIMTQLPLSVTLVDFWALVHDLGCVTVVTMNRLQDLDQTYTAFWPQDSSSHYGPFQVKLNSEKAAEGFTTRHLTLQKHKQKVEREIKMLQLDSWKMGDPIPQSPNSIIDIMEQLEPWQSDRGNKPILVTCWDGANRCGVFCASSFTCQQMQQEGLVDVFQAVKTIRSSRPQVISTTDQYAFCYRVALAYRDLRTSKKRENIEEAHSEAGRAQ
ncbi:receptor-type tyrosine-protein phosphatase kappa-like [Scyliorhinus torazame]|uniref:receptor-type tyrosine-protein phosphatase kappa-like n=1 Tax=Scyliorhinus torazame TaxID=75743 RepID=UPI003B5B9BE0